MQAGRLKILASGGYCEFAKEVDGRLPELKHLVKESTGVAVRRITRFVQLALIGAGRCASQMAPAPETAVYFTSCRGDTEVTTELLDDLIKRRELPGPLTFVNSVSNAACFQVASALGLHERSNFVTSRFFPLEAALKSAWVDIAHGEVKTALVGSVDACSAPLANHLRRTQRQPGAPVGEASHWFLLAGEKEKGQALAWVSVIRNFADRESVNRWVQESSLPSGTVLAAGQHLSEEDALMISGLGEFAGRFDYRKSLPEYDSQTGAALEQFIASEHTAMLHVDSDPAGRFSVLLVEC